MAGSPLINLFILLFTIFLCASVAFSVYFANRKNRMNQFFLLLTVAVILYLTFSYLSNYSTDYYRALFYKKLFLAMVSLFIIFSYLFSIHFPKEGKRYPILEGGVVIIETIFIFFLLTTDFIVKGIKYQEWGTDAIWGPGKDIFFATMILLSFLIAVQIFKNYYGLSGEKKRQQVQFFLVGIVIFAAANIIFNMIFSAWRNADKYQYIGIYSTIVLYGFIAYAIVRHDLFKIRLAVYQFLVSLFAALLLFQFFLSKLLFEYVWSSILFVIFSFLSYFLIKSLFREIELKTRIAELGNEILERAKRLAQVPKGIIEQTERLITEREELKKKWFFSDIEKELEVGRLKTRIEELEKERNTK